MQARVVFLGVNVLNPSVYLAVALVYCVIVVAACIGPALRASRLDPLIALRTDCVSHWNPTPRPAGALPELS